MKISMKFEGGAELAKALEQLPVRVSRRVQLEALKDAAEPMRKRMADLAPRGDPKQPNLKDNMVINTSRGQDAQEAAVAVGPSLSGFYGSFQEFGTVHHGAQPFARPAFDEMVLKSLAIIGQALWTALAGRGISRSVTESTPVEGGPGGGLV